VEEGGKGRLALAGLISLLGFVVQSHAPALLEAGLAGTPRTVAIVSTVSGVLGWLGLAALGVAAVDMGARRAAASQHGAAPPRLLQDIARAGFYGGAILAILAFVFGQPIAGLVATSGVLVAVIGFALRNMIADVFSGIALNLEHPYRIGDWIEVAPGTVGRVAEINWRATRLVTRDHISVVVPNGLIAASRFANFSYPERHYRASVRLALSPLVSVERAKQVLHTALRGAPHILAEPHPEVQVEGIDERGVTYLLRYWVGDYSDDNGCRDAVVTSALRCLTQAGLAPAFPHRDISLHRRGEEESAPTLRDELHHVPLFHSFNDGELDQLAARARRHRFREGERLVAEGEAGASLFVLAEGVLEVAVAAMPGRPLVVDRMMPGDVFGEISLLTGQPRSATVTAATDGLAYEIGKADLQPILKARPVLAEDLAELMVKRQRNNRQRLEEAAPQSAPDTAEPNAVLERLRAFFGLKG
jgi:small-conductance mechanosensitive channel